MGLTATEKEGRLLNTPSDLSVTRAGIAFLTKFVKKSVQLGFEPRNPEGSVLWGAVFDHSTTGRSGGYSCRRESRLRPPFSPTLNATKSAPPWQNAFEMAIFQPGGVPSRHFMAVSPNEKYTGLGYLDPYLTCGGRPQGGTPPLALQTEHSDHEGYCLLFTQSG